MRKFLSSIAIALLVLSLAACKKVPDTLLDQGTMTANVGGVSFNASSCYEHFVLGKTEDYVIKGAGTDGVSFIVIDIKRDQFGLGDKYVDNNGNGNSAAYVIHNNTLYATSGTVSISSDSAGVATSGTFNFTAADGTAVTSGSFRAVFQ